MVAPRTVSDYLHRDGFTRKKVSDEPEKYPDDRVFQEIEEYLKQIESIPWDRRVYMDESFIYDNEAPRMGRSI